MTKEIKVPEYDASARQSLFHTSTAFETLYGGAAGGGKTAAICAEAVTVALEYPGIRVYIFRRTVPELKESVVPEILKQCSDFVNAGYMAYNAQDRQFRIKHPVKKGERPKPDSLIQLAYLDDPNDRFRYQSAEIHVLFFDELTHFSWDEYEYIRTRVRSADPKMPLKIMCATNPGGLGHSWVKSYFIDVSKPEIIYTDKETGLTRIFIPAKVTDHPSKAFQESYMSKLNAISDPELKRALRDGDWDIFQGQVFSEFRRTKTVKGEEVDWHVVEPFDIPDFWTRWMGYDYGAGKHPSVGLWFTKDPTNGRVYIYREYTAYGTPISEQAETIRMMEGTEQIRFRAGDPSLWKHKASAETGETLAEMFESNNLHFIEANNDRAAGKELWHEYLRTSEDGKPKMQIFSSCLGTIKTIPTLPYDPHKPNDVDTDAEDDWYDAGRYGLAGSGATSGKAQIYKPPNMLKRKLKR